MPSLIDDQGLKISAFEPVLAAALGNAKGAEGCNVLAITASYGRAQVQLRDWIYCLVQTPATVLRKRWIDRPGKTAKDFLRAIEEGVDSEGEPRGVSPAEMTAGTATSEVAMMLAVAERIARDNARPAVHDEVLTLAILQAANADLRAVLDLWDPRLPDLIKSLQDGLRPQGDIPQVFDAQGKLNAKAFEHSGRRFLQRLSEDACSLGGKKITTRHMLYTLLDNPNGPLHVALTVRGVDVKKELHATLARELGRPGRKRGASAELTRESAFEPVHLALQEAVALALKRGARKAAEVDIHRAFLAKQAKELARLFPAARPLDVAGLIAAVEETEVEAEEEEKSSNRMPAQEIERLIKQRICGQEAAVDAILPWIKRLRFGLPRDGRPAGVFLFLGPTGTGKTQLAKELARYVFGGEEEMIFIEMGQFQSKESMSGFIGAPPGYVGYGEGKLTNGLRDKPECVVLFDEIEKAETSVFDALLRFCDEGLISDPAGPVRDGRKCVIVLTTNAGQKWMRAHFKANPAAREGPIAAGPHLFKGNLKRFQDHGFVRGVLQASDDGASAGPHRAELSVQLYVAATEELQKDKGFRPEFLGRVDSRISFLPFTIATCRKIVDGVLEREAEKLLRLKGIHLDITEDARDAMARMAYERSIEEGARCAPRAVNDCIVTPAIDTLSALEEGASEGDAEKQASADEVDLPDLIAFTEAQPALPTAPADRPEVPAPDAAPTPSEAAGAESEEAPPPEEPTAPPGPCPAPGPRIRLLALSQDSCRLAADATLDAAAVRLQERTGACVDFSFDVRAELALRAFARPPGEVARALTEGAAACLDRVRRELTIGDSRVIVRDGTLPFSLETCRKLLDAWLATALPTLAGLALDVDDGAREYLAQRVFAATGPWRPSRETVAIATALVLVPARALIPVTRPADRGKPPASPLPCVATLLGTSEIKLELV